MRCRVAEELAAANRSGRLTPRQRSLGRSSGPSPPRSLSSLRKRPRSVNTVSISDAWRSRTSGIHGILPSGGSMIWEVRPLLITSRPKPLNALL